MKLLDSGGAHLGMITMDTSLMNRVKDGTSGRGTDLTTENKGLPIDYRYSVVIVPKGQAFSGWASYPLP